MIDTTLNGKEIVAKDFANLIIGGQTGVDGIRFCIAQTVAGEDLTDNTLSWYLQFKNKNGQGESVLLTPIYEDSLVKLSWVPGITATQISGRLQIQIYATKIVGETITKKWVSAPAVVYIEENLNPDAIIPATPTLLDEYLVSFTNLKDAAEASAADALNSKNAAEAAAASVLVTSYYGLRRRSDGVRTRTGAAATMTPARSNGTYNPTVSDFRKVRPWSDIRLCLTDRTNKVVAVQGDDNFITMANTKNGDGSHVWNFGSLFYPFYQKIWTGVDENSYAFKEWDVSAIKLPGYNMHPAFIREDGTIRPYIVINSYKTGEDVDGKVCSKPGVVPLTITSTLSFDTKYTQLDPASKWVGNHFTTNDAWKILVCIEWGTMDIQTAVGQGISSGMPYGSSAIYQLTQATDNGNTVTIAASGQPFYAGMDIQIGSSYSNSSYAKNRKILSVDTTTNPGSMIITVDGASFSAPIGGWIVTWGQSDTVDNLLQIGTGCGWISQWGAESRSHVYIYGMVDPYANVFEFERGKMRKSKKFYINFNPLTSSGITDPETAGYTDCGEFSTGAATYGWISDFKIVTLGDHQTQLVSAVGGNSIGDVIYYADDIRTGTYVCCRGGRWDGGSGYGPFYEYWSSSPSDAYFDRGDRGIILEPALQAA